MSSGSTSFKKQIRCHRVQIYSSITQWSFSPYPPSIRPIVRRPLNIGSRSDRQDFPYKRLIKLRSYLSLLPLFARMWYRCLPLVNCPVLVFFGTLLRGSFSSLCSLVLPWVRVWFVSFLLEDVVSGKTSFCFRRCFRSTVVLQRRGLGKWKSNFIGFDEKRWEKT